MATKVEFTFSSVKLFMAPSQTLWVLQSTTSKSTTRNQTHPLADDQARFRKPMLAWKDGASIETALRFVGGAPAARALNEQLGTTKFTQAGISAAASRENKHNGWRFKFDETVEAIAARAAQRARVIAAIAALRAAAAGV